MRQKAKKGFILITLISLAVLALVPQALAATEGTGWKISGNTNGLTIEAQPNGQGTGNLNPGDTKDSKLKLTNTNSTDVKVWIKTNVTKRSCFGEGDLAKVLHLLIKNGDTVITDKSFNDADKEGSIFIGTMKPNEVIYLDFTVILPGPETDNKYQGCSIDANWTFTTQTTGGGGGHNPGGGSSRDPSRPDPKDPDEPDEIIDEEPVPEGPTEPPVDTDTPDVIIEEEPVPGGFVKMPKTGEIPPALFYGVGSLAVAMGVMARKRKK